MSVLLGRRLPFKARKRNLGYAMHARTRVAEPHRCVASCDERHDDKEGAVTHGEPVWQMAPHFSCTSQSASEGTKAVRDGVVRAVDACVR
eukprot:6203302-Pleurochrysis_carterae.AAC.2